MNVYIDGSSILRKPDGIGRYSKEIYAKLKDTTILTYSDVDDFGYKVERLPIPRKLYYLIYKKIWRMPVDKFLKSKPDIMIYPNFVMLPLVKSAKSVVVIHDLAYLKTPEFVSDKNKKYLSKFVPESIRNSDFVIAVSNTTKEELLAEFDLPEDKVFVAPNCVDQKVFSRVTDASIKNVRKKYKITDDYFLFVGTIEPRKNILGLLQAYEMLGKDSPPLVLAGGEGWKNEDIHKKIDQLKATGFNIIVTGFVTDEDLPSLYSGASMLVLPSHFEGFGIPILEAQASGTPVITSDINPMKEVAGEAALLIDQNDPDDIADKMALLYGDPKLQTQLIKKGYKNVSRYSWDKSAKVFQDVIERLSK